MKILTEQELKEKVFDFENNTEWNFKGDKPCILDFYADWCQPCKQMIPILENIETKYGDKLDIYKINIEDEPGLSQVFSIQSIPSLLFIPMDNQPQMNVGLMKEDVVKKVIKEILEIEINE